jgi:hypothetical protein
MTQAVQKANYVKRGAGARTKLLDSARYYTYRAGLEREQRTWRDQDGQVVSYADVRAGISAAAEQYTYSYRMVLSPGGPASPELYQHHLAGMFDRYYLINHENTEHAHVHVIGFRNTTLRRGQLREQQQQLTRRVALEREQEQERHQALVRQRGRGLGL